MPGRGEKTASGALPLPGHRRLDLSSRRRRKEGPIPLSPASSAALFADFPIRAAGSSIPQPLSKGADGKERNKAAKRSKEGCSLRREHLEKLSLDSQLTLTLGRFLTSLRAVCEPMNPAAPVMRITLGS